MQSGIYDKFVEEYVKAFKAKHNVIGDPEVQGNQIGPVVDKSQYDRIMGLISDAQKNHEGLLVAGGKGMGSKASKPILLN